VPEQTIRIAIAGLGTVGASTFRILQEEAEMLAARSGATYEIVAVSAKDKNRDRGIDLSGVRWVTDARALAHDPEVDLIIELIGGSEGVAKELCEAALKAGKHVVTANKALIAEHGQALAELAEAQDVCLMFEAAVTAAIPVVKAFREGLSANRIHRIAGIMNGTCNYMLTEMEETGEDFDTILKRAQEMGFAEADPSFDVDGIDTAHKLAILASLAFGTTLDFSAVHIEGIRSITPEDIAYARMMGYRIKLLGIATPTDAGIEQRVHPCMVALDQPMANIPAEYNAIETEGSACGKMFFEGAGAGGDATASAVIADVVDILRGLRVPILGMASGALQPLQAAPMQAHRGSYYIRVRVEDAPGVLAKISTVFYEQGISVKSFVQQGEQEGKEDVQLVIITHETREDAMQSALKAVGNLPVTKEPPHMIRIESL